MFEPVQRRLARQRRAAGSLRFQLSRHKPQHRIVAQLIVIVNILVAQRNAMNALGEQRLDRVLDAVLPAAIFETGRDLPRQVDTAISLWQEAMRRRSR